MAGSDAVVVFARSPRAGAVKTRLCPPLTPDGAASLYRAFLGDTVELVAGVSGVHRAIAFTPSADGGVFARLAPRFALMAQQGADLGARMRHAFATLFRAGATAAVTIGADVPTLPQERITEALARLANPRVDVVLGPSDDGGYHLIGMTRLHPTLFDDVAWSTPSVLAQTLSRAHAARLGVSLLPAWFDVDVPADLERLEQSLVDPSIHAPRTRAALRAWTESRL